MPPAREHGSGISRTPPPAQAQRKSLAARSADVSTPAPCEGSGAASPGGLTDWTPCGEVDAPQGETAGKGSPTY
jgi:hypothetical protein